MMSIDVFHKLRGMEWPVRYAALVDMVREHQSLLPPGRVLGTTDYGICFFPRLRELERNEQGNFFHWLAVIAKHNPDLPYASERGPGKGYATGKTVTHYLWGNKGDTK